MLAASTSSSNTIRKRCCCWLLIKQNKNKNQNKLYSTQNLRIIRICNNNNTNNKQTGIRYFAETKRSTTSTTINPIKEAIVQIEKKVNTTSTTTTSTTNKKKKWYYSAELWGKLGAISAWGISGSALYDSFIHGPEVISLSMTPILIIYSTLCIRWAYIVKPQNLLLCTCHITNVLTQSNQLRRAIQYKMHNTIGSHHDNDQIQQQQELEVRQYIQMIVAGGTILTGIVIAGPAIRSLLATSNNAIMNQIAIANAGPFTVHFWTPLSKLMISGASVFDLHRPTDQISLAQYIALTFNGFFFSPYSLLVSPINYMFCTVNLALFGSSAWHLGRKIHADYIHPFKKKKEIFC